MRMVQSNENFLAVYPYAWEAVGLVYVRYYTGRIEVVRNQKDGDPD